MNYTVGLFIGAICTALPFLISYGLGYWWTKGSIAARREAAEKALEQLCLSHKLREERRSS